MSGRGEAWAGPRYESATVGGNSSRQAGPLREIDGLPVPLAAEGEPRDKFEHERTGGGAARPHGGTLQVGGGWRRIRIDPRDRAVTLPAGVGLDFGGIAKGMAVDAAIARLRAMGLRSALVNAGGDLAVLGAPLGGDVWPIAVTGTGIESALDPSASRTVPLRSGALATSGIARRHWRQGGKQRHHLVDPRTGEPAESGLWSVSVAAERCEQAEVAAKVAFLLGMERGAWFLDGHGLAGLLAATGGTWRSVGGWPIEGEASR